MIEVTALAPQKRVNAGMICMRFFLAAAFCTGFPAGGNPARADATAAGFRFERVETSFALLRDGTIVWRFVHDPRYGKVHFDPLGPAGGPALTWSMPPDHPWHYGLWWSWKFINGVNYWEEDPKTHRAAGETRVEQLEIEPRGEAAARIAVSLSYAPAGGTERGAPKPVLTERRIIEITPPSADGSYMIDWDATFTAGEQDVVLDRTPLPGEPGGRAYGGYAGLSARLRQLEDRKVISTEGEVAFNDAERFRGRARALDYSGVLEGRTAGIAILDHPSNPRSPTPWYVIRSRAMTYFSPAFLCYEPYTLKAKAALRLRYRIIVHPGRWDSSRLLTAWKEFAGAGPPGARDGAARGRPSKSKR